jgi:hypothetical protein
MCASDALCAAMSKDEDRLAAGEDIDTSPYEDFHAQSTLRFYTWLMMGTHTRKKVLQQRQLFSFVLHFHGLTRSGLEILSRAGVCSSRSTFSRWWQSALQEKAQAARSGLSCSSLEDHGPRD